MGWEFKTCIHGVTEELDFHPCDKCQEMALEMGWEVIPRIKTYIFTKEWLEKNMKEEPSEFGFCGECGMYFYKNDGKWHPCSDDLIEMSDLEVDQVEDIPLIECSDH